MSRAERRPFLGRFRDPVFAEVGEPAAISGFDFLRRPLLGHRDQRDVAGIAPRCLGGARDLVADFGKAGCGVSHQRAL